ncbi:MAG: penicillin acylase family protein [Bacteroidetes bacterium]|nr:penicillin acylase family protein [Bacteroidota bacterium]
MKIKSILSFLALLFLIVACNTADPNLSKWQKQAENITIIRDNWGIPHVYGKTDADAVFGLLYAQCEDDFNRVEVNYATAMGRMAEFEGESSLSADLRMKLYIDPVEVKKEYENSPKWLKKLMDAFADGINYYLYTHPEVKPKIITHFEPWMALTFSEGSIGGDIEQISTRDLASFYLNNTKKEVAEVIIDQDTEPRGSNGFAISPKNTVNGNALFLINPHTSFFFRPEVHMTSEEGLNAYGAVTWGQFFVYQGFNDKCGWMHTSSAADVIDYYYETIVEQDGKYFYKYGAELKPVIEKEITLKYKDGQKLSEKKVTAYYTHHGPIIREAGDKWVSISLMVEHEKALTQSYMRTKASSYDEFYQTMEIKTNSSNNTVYADADGNIAYFHGNFMPVRNENYNWKGIVDGSDPETDWKGLHDIKDMIHVLNPENGWIQNCNATPFTVSGNFSPKREDFPTYMAPDLQNFRQLHAVMVLENQTDFTLEKLRDAAYDSYLPAFVSYIPALLDDYANLNSSDEKLKDELREPTEALRKWDLRFSEESIETSLAVYWGQEMMNAARILQIAPEINVYDYLANGMSSENRLNSLLLAVNKLKNDFGSWKTPWGEINRYQRVNGEIEQPFNDNLPSLPVGFTSSRWGSLASFGSRAYPGTKKMYGTSGNSFVCIVEFGEKIIAKSSLAGGQSGDPDSPHFADQALDYTKGKFKDVNFYKADIEKNAERTYHPGEK